MPELPEVEVVRRGLEGHVVGRVIESVEVLHPRPVRSMGGEAFAHAVTGRKVVAARRRGKYLWLPLDDAEHGDAMQAHLGMSGQLLVQTPGLPDERHLRIRMRLDDGAELRFVDQRMFGGLSVSPGGALLPPEIAHVAPDPLEDAFDAEAVVVRVRRSSSGIKRLLLTQTVLSGVGNIYADEALWRAGVHGERPGNRISASEVRALIVHVQEVMRDALAQGGTSFDSLYVNVNGESGFFARHLDAYGRAGQPCNRCGTPIMRAHFMNRSSYFCTTCQKLPRGS